MFRLRVAMLAKGVSEAGMKIVGLQGVSGGELNSELARGARFVCYPYCISAIVTTFRRSSPIYFIRAEQSGAAKAAPFCAISLLLGWWGIPWGPLHPW